MRCRDPSVRPDGPVSTGRGLAMACLRLAAFTLVPALAVRKGPAGDTDPPAVKDACNEQFQAEQTVFDDP